ncbi:MAG: helix-turn-helix transcriptional regulator [Lachnospiraceae bacterium]|jgi:AraC-like DNA-binding protein|nr:helix-turn-helix transcriptional regulator [Lachnospiraceae bacterium]
MKKGRTLRRWQLSYVAILLLPLVFGCVIYFHSLSTIQKETKELQYQLLLQDETVLRHVLEQLRKEGTELLHSSYVKSLAVPDLEPEFERDRLGMVQNLLQDRLSVGEALSNAYLFYPQRNLIVGSRVSFRMTEEMWVQEDLYLADPAVKAIMEENPYNRLYFLQGTKSDALAYSLSGNYKEAFWEQNVVLLCFLNKSWLSGQFPDMDTAVLLQTRDGEIRKIGGGIEEEEDWSAFDVKEEALIHKKGYAVLKEELPEYQLSLFCIRRDTVFRQELLIGIGILAAYIAASLGVGLSLSSYLSKRNYKPVDDLLKLIRQGASGGERGEQEDEFELIRNRLQRLLKGYEQKAEESFRQERQIQDAQVGRFLLGQRNKYTSLDQEEWERLKQVLPNEYYSVVQFDFEEVEEALLGEQLNEESMELLYFIVQNVAGDVLSEQYPFLSGSLGGYEYLILNGADKPEPFAAKIKERIEEIITFLRQTYGFRICANISQVGTCLADVEEGYRQVRRLNEYRNYIGTPYSVLSYEMLEQEVKEPEAKRKAESEPEIKKETEGKTEGENQRERKERKSPMARKGSVDETIEQIQDWLSSHYNEQQLTVAVVAEQFSLNLTYLSRIFKQKTGTGVLDYINQLRVERAKELLQEGLTVKAAAEEVGYYTVRPLMRAFREQVGMTPGEYAKIQAEKGRISGL